VQDVDAFHPQVAAEDVGGRLLFGMADVQAGAAGVGNMSSTYALGILPASAGSIAANVLLASQ